MDDPIDFGPSLSDGEYREVSALQFWKETVTGKSSKHGATL